MCTGETGSQSFVKIPKKIEDKNLYESPYKPRLRV